MQLSHPKVIQKQFYQPPKTTLSSTQLMGLTKKGLNNNSGGQLTDEREAYEKAC